MILNICLYHLILHWNRGIKIAWCGQNIRRCSFSHNYIKQFVFAAFLFPETVNFESVGLLSQKVDQSMQIWFSEKALAIKSIHIPGIKNSEGRVLAQAYILRFCLRCFFHIYTRTVRKVNIFAAVVTKNKKHVLIKIATMIMMMMAMRIMMTVIV